MQQLVKILKWCCSFVSSLTFLSQFYLFKFVGLFVRFSTSFGNFFLVIFQQAGETPSLTRKHGFQQISFLSYSHTIFAQLPYSRSLFLIQTEKNHSYQILGLRTQPSSQTNRLKSSVYKEVELYCTLDFIFVWYCRVDLSSVSFPTKQKTEAINVDTMGSFYSHQWVQEAWITLYSTQL